MALIRVSKNLLKEDWFAETFLNAFDTIQDFGDDEFDVKIFRVQREEIPIDDKFICPSFYQFKGVLPFIIDFDT